MGTQFLKHVKRYPPYCVADDQAGDQRPGVEVVACELLETCQDDEQVGGEYHVCMLVGPTHLAHFSI